MKRALSLVVFAALVCALGPSLAFAHGPRGGSSGFRGGHVVGSFRSGTGFVVQKRFAVPQNSVFPQPVDQWKSWGVAPKHLGRHHVPFTPFVGAPGFIGTPSVVVTSPGASEVVHTTTVVYAPPAMSAPVPGPALSAASTLPTPAIVDYPGGWYQLRGDGVTTPYSWVWVPKPPAPPASAPESAPSAQAPDAPARSADARARDDRGPAYHWTDDGGVTTWTNRLDRIPKRFRDRAAATVQPD